MKDLSERFPVNRNTIIHTVDKKVLEKKKKTTEFPNKKRRTDITVSLQYRVQFHNNYQVIQRNNVTKNFFPCFLHID